MLSSAILSTARRRSVGIRSATRRFGSDMPLPQSANAKLFAGHPESEGWEWTIAWFYPTSFLMICGILAFQPETSINAWAKQEASVRLQLKEQGMTDFKFGVHYQNLSDDELKVTWDKFSDKALRMTDDDDDDEEDEEDEDEDE